LIIVDTNVVSEPLRPRGSEAVTAWLDAQVAETLYITAINAAELWAVVAMLAQGPRKSALEASLDALLAQLFEERYLDFDRAAARLYAEVVRRTSLAGTTIPLGDGLIASIALSRAFAVATRDVAPFRAAGVEVINPWEYDGRS